jgi:hypothetical protein
MKEVVIRHMNVVVQCQHRSLSLSLLCPKPRLGKERTIKKGNKQNCL